MKTLTQAKQLIIALLFILTFAFAQQVQAQETKEYVTVMLSINGGYAEFAIAYPDGKTEKGELLNYGAKKIDKNAITINEIFNRLAKEGYRLVSNGGGEVYTFFVFEK